MRKNNRNTRQEKLDKITSINELLKFAERNASTHTRFYHYTTLDSLHKILDKKTIRLSRGDQMNDLQELTKGSYIIWQKTFVTSFCFGESENIAMWTMYGVPWNMGVRLSFSGKEFVKWVNDVKEVECVESDYPVKRVIPEKVILTDVMYSAYHEIDGTEKIRLDNYSLINTKSQFGEENISRLESITGYVKNRAWEFENESRIKVTLKSREYDCKKISLKLTDELLHTAEITLSPWMDSDVVTGVKNKYIGIQVIESKFSGLVNIKATCSQCKSDFAVYGSR